MGGVTNAGLFREDPGDNRSSSGIIRLSNKWSPGETVVIQHDTVTPGGEPTKTLLVLVELR